MARMTTSSRAAAMSTAAVGDSPKIVVRSDTAERGSAEPPSSRRSSLLVVVLVLEPERSALTLPDALPPGVLSVRDALPLAPEPDCTCGGGTGVGLEDEDWASTSDTGAASSATPSRAANKAFITAPPRRGRQQGGCHRAVRGGKELCV